MSKKNIKDIASVISGDGSEMASLLDQFAKGEVDKDEVVTAAKDIKRKSKAKPNNAGKVLPRLMCGDMLQVLQGIDSKFELVIADPPYSSGGLMRSDKMATTKTKYLQSDSGNQIKLPDFLGDNRDQRAFYAWCVYWMEQANRILKEEAILAVFTDWRQLPTVTDAVQGAGLVWRLRTTSSRRSTRSSTATAGSAA